MDKQIELTLTKDWQEIKVDKVRLVEEHKEGKQEFDKNLFFLEQDTNDVIDWTEIDKLYERI